MLGFKPDLQLPEFHYERFEVRAYSVSYYAYRGRLFTAYRWDKQKKRCFYYFNDPEKMKAYLAPVGQSERAPETYAVPEELLQD